MRAHRRRLALGPPLPARVLELPDQLLFLGVHADHRVAGALVGPGLLADVAELGVPVRVPRPLDGLGVALQAEPLGPQQVPDRVRGDLMALPGQLTREIAGRLGDPPQRRHRIAALLRLDQGQQCRAQPRIHIGGPLAAPARPPRPAQRLRAGLQLVNAQGHRGLADPGRPGHQPDPAMPQRPRLSARSAAAAAAHPDAGRSPRTSPPASACFLLTAHTTTACRIPGSYGLFFCSFLSGIPEVLLVTRGQPGAGPGRGGGQHLIG